MGGRVPVYIFTGFLESGKTTFIIDTLKDPNFAEGTKTLVICCEEGEVEYEEDILSETNTVIEYVEDMETLSHEYFEGLQKKHKPGQVIIEYNGTWPMEALLNLEPPKKWAVAEILSTADASTFFGYMSNMKSMLLDQFSQSDVLIFNRCQLDTPKATFARTVKANNRRLRFIFENADGTIDNDFEEELPYDINAKEIIIGDDDFGIFYMDAMEHPENYANKKVSFKAMVYKDKKMSENEFVPGRHCMTCCEDDIAFLGFMSYYDNANDLKVKDWVDITATVKIQYVKEYHGDGPVLYIEELSHSEAPEETLLYF